MDERRDFASERKFLHDLASPLGTAMLLADVIIEDLRCLLPVVSADLVDQSVNLGTALEQVAKLLNHQRMQVREAATSA